MPDDIITATADTTYAQVDTSTSPATVLQIVPVLAGERVLPSDNPNHTLIELPAGSPAVARVDMGWALVLEGIALMAALTNDRNTPRRSGHTIEPPVKANTIIYQGAMVAIGTDSLAVPASSTPTLKVIGRAERRADNSAGANGDIRVPALVGTFRYANSTGA